MSFSDEEFTTRPDILLCPNIPKPLHGLNPRTIKGDDWWNTVRQEAYVRNNYHCWACGIHKRDAEYHKWLEAHELYKYDYVNGTAELDEVVALCHRCHNYIHNGRLEMLLSRDEIDFGKFTDVLVSGSLILIANKLPINEFAFSVMERNNICLPKEISDYKIQKTNITSIAEWSSWRLIIDGDKYKPLHDSFASWKKYYTNHKGVI